MQLQNVILRNLNLATLAIGLLMALVLTGPIMTSDMDPSTQGNAVRQLGYLTIFAIAIASVRVNGLRFRVMVLPLSMLAVLLYCGFTLTWAFDFSVGIRRLILTVTVIMIIFLLVAETGFEKATDAFRVFMALAIVANYLVVILMPNVGIHPPGELDAALVGNWRGFMQQKNFAGPLCAFIILYFIFDAGRIPKWFRWGMLAITAFFLAKTMSKTSMGVLVVCVALGIGLLRYNPRYRVLAVSLFVLLVLCMLVGSIVFWDDIVAPFSSEDSLTGRVQIWPVLIAFFRDHPWTGAGYGCFWNAGVNSPILEYTKSDDWVGQIFSGHNGYLDLVVQIGLPGVVLTVVMTIIWPIIQILSSKQISAQQRSLLFTIILFCAAHNMTESSLMDRDQIVQVFLVIGLALLRAASRPAGVETVNTGFLAGVRPGRPTAAIP